FVHQRIARLPPAALKVYRNRAEAQAKKLYDQAVAESDPSLLRRVVDEAFCTRSGEAALDRLGDWAFEQGRFEEALRYWQMIALPPSEETNKRQQPSEPASLVFPDPQKNLALIRAKQLLALLFMEDRARYDGEWKSFKGIHGKAEGSLAGRKGNYAAILEVLAKNPPAPPDQPLLDNWPTFAGGPERRGGSGRLPDHPNWLARQCGDPPCIFDLANLTVVDTK